MTSSRLMSGSINVHSSTAAARNAARRAVASEMVDAVSLPKTMLISEKK